MTYKMLEDSDKSLVLFVMNARQLNINDQKIFMDYVCNCMEKGGKQSRERYIFAINQMDGFNPEDENPEDALKSAKKVLEDYKIPLPNLFPVSALAALECRTQPKIPSVLPMFRPRVKAFSEMKFDSYYEYNNLPLPAKHDIESMLEKLNDEESLEIHSGIVSIEKAIGLYVDKYARALKVKDLVDSFNNRLNELKAVALLQADIRKNKDKKTQLDNQIRDIQGQIDSGKSAQTLSRLIDKKDLAANVTNDIDEYVNATKTKIDRLIFDHTNDTKVLKSEALRQVKTVEDESYEILSQLDSLISSILEKGYKMLFEDILNEYRGYLNELGIKCGSGELSLKPLDFVAEELKNLDDLMAYSTQTVDEGHDETRTRIVQGEKKTNWFFTPWNWGSERFKEKEEQYQIHIPHNVEYVNMKTVVSEYLEPLQQQLIGAKEAASAHARSESARIKEMLKEYLERIDNILKNKLTELKQSTEASNQTQQEIEKQQANLKWMESVIERVNKLINF